jgi:hypothetical protein
MQKRFVLFILLGIFLNSRSFGQNENVRINPVNFSAVVIADAFWKPKIDKVATKTLEACIYQTEFKTGRIRNFEKAARNTGEKHEGVFYDDSDVFKAIEAMAYSIKNTRSSELEKKADEWIDKIAAAQQPDGYLNTFYVLTGLEKRWQDMSMHEDYCGGHMIEAAVAYFDATGKRKFLDVAIKWADHFDQTFGPGKKDWVTGHQELELALVKLYRTTNNQKYLKLADWLLSERGKRLAKGYTWSEWKDTGYTQDLLPVKEQSEITGHAVRAMYMYTGAADVAATTGDQDYLKAMRRVWEDVVYRNMYITGGIGSAGSNEGFTVDYDLPNEQAYCETCASVGMIFWNQRMNMLTGNAEYIDILEKSLYNGALDGLSISGDRFFYGNPLASIGKNARKEWFGTACCPSNIARMIASLGGYIYGQKENKLYVNLFVSSQTSFPLQKNILQLKQETEYPWTGKMKFTVQIPRKEKATIAIRIPGWAMNKAVPGDLYTFLENSNGRPAITINGQSCTYAIDNGYAVIEREWKDGDMLEYVLPMDIRKVRSRGEIKENNARIALQRGPVIYCVEGADNDGKVWNIVSSQESSWKTEPYKVLDESIVSLVSSLPVVELDKVANRVQMNSKPVRAIPYYTWCNRGSNPMQVWLPTSIEDIKINYR